MTKRTEIDRSGILSSIESQFFNYNQQTMQGFGLDAAIINDTASASNIWVEDIHFDLTYVPLQHLGYKTVAAVIANLNAVNATATHVQISLAISNRFSVEAIEAFFEGVKMACDFYKLDVLQGDMTSSKTGLIISANAQGLVKDPVNRSGGKINDILCISGDLGAAYMGLQVLEREKQVFLSDPNMQPELGDKSYLIQRQLRPDAKTDLIAELAEIGVVPSSMINLSNGLAEAVVALATSSGLGAQIFEEKILIDDQTHLAATEFNMSAMTAALHGGGDYELLFSLSPADYEKVQDLPDVLPVGFFTENKAKELVMKSGSNISLTTI
jgi:thiamine-monophosphate kinase